MKPNKRRPGKKPARRINLRVGIPGKRGKGGASLRVLVLEKTGKRVRGGLKNRSKQETQRREGGARAEEKKNASLRTIDRKGCNGKKAGGIIDGKETPAEGRIKS